MPIELIIFDCDGVLIDSEIISANMLVGELSKLGIEIDLDFVVRNFLGRSYPVVMAQIRREFGVTLTAEFEEEYRQRLLAAFERELRVTAHVREVLDQLLTPFCVATSSSPSRAERSLKIAGLGHLTGPRLFTSSMVANGKPAPDLFLHAARGSGAEPGACLVIEDSLTGIRAAHAAGMEVWRFTGGSHLAGRDLNEPDDARPHLRFASFADFFQIDPRLRRRG